MHWCYPNPPSGNVGSKWSPYPSRFRDSIFSATPNIFFWPAKVLYCGKCCNLNLGLSFQPSSDMLEEVFSEDACAMFSQCLFDSVEVKLSNGDPFQTYLPGRLPEAGFQMEVAMNAIKLCKWIGISSSLPTLRINLGLVLSTQKGRFSVEACWS